MDNNENKPLEDWRNNIQQGERQNPYRGQQQGFNPNPYQGQNPAPSQNPYQGQKQSFSTVSFQGQNPYQGQQQGNSTIPYQGHSPYQGQQQGYTPNPQPGQQQYAPNPYQRQQQPAPAQAPQRPVDPALLKKATEEVNKMAVPKLVWSLILFLPIGIVAMIFFLKAKSILATDPGEALNLVEKFNQFGSVAILVGVFVFPGWLFFLFMFRPYNEHYRQRKVSAKQIMQRVEQEYESLLV